MNRKEIKAKLAARYTHKRELGVPVVSRGGTASEENDIQAGLAELFVCQQLAIPCDLDVTDAGDGGFDSIYQGQKLDVKWLGRYSNGQPRRNGRIIVDIGKLKSDLYIAVSGSERQGYEMRGWCTAADLIASIPCIMPYPDAKGRHERYALFVNELRPMDALAPGIETKGKVW